jgi:peptide chain release factor 2
LLDDLKVLFEFFETGEGSEEEIIKNYEKVVKAIDKLEFRKMLSKEEDRLNAIVNINSGAGGTESQDWAEMLMRMYLRWGERNNYKSNVLDIQEGDGAGIKVPLLRLKEKMPLGILKEKAGYTGSSDCHLLMPTINATHHLLQSIPTLL